MGDRRYPIGRRWFGDNDLTRRFPDHISQICMRGNGVGILITRKSVTVEKADDYRLRIIEGLLQGQSGLVDDRSPLGTHRRD
ncbi:hypothetical protein Trydic_g5532 [Trypoxylus dichotomus]